MRSTTYILPVIVLALAGLLSSIFIVDEREKALVLQFGRLVDIKDEPGLAFKIPMWNSSVRRQVRAAIRPSKWRDADLTQSCVRKRAKSWVRFRPTTS